MGASTTQKSRWVRLVGVYDVDAGLLGEIAYVTGRLLGIAHCALCEITHTAAGEKPSFALARSGLGVPMLTLHRNQQPEALRALTQGRQAKRRIDMFPPCAGARPASSTTRVSHRS